MPVAESILSSIEKSSWIRKMFEEGARLKAQYGADNVFDFSLGNPDIEPPEEFFKTLTNISSLRKPGVHGYMPNAGFPDVREKIAGRASAEQQVTLKGDSIVMTCGAAGGINAVLKTILNPGDEIIVPAPYFVEYTFYASNHQGSVKAVSTKPDFSLDISSISEAITERTKAVLINSPNNPTGRIYPESDIKELANVLRQQDHPIYLISDEPYREIVYDGITVPPLLKLYENAITVTSFSKSLSLPGERIGYVTVHPECADYDILMAGIILCNRILGYVNAPALMQRVVAELSDATVRIDEYQKRRDIFAEGLDKAGYDFVLPDGSFYLFCKSPMESDIDFVKHLQNFNILVVPGSGFHGPGYFRIAYCVSEDIIKRSLPKFAEAYAQAG